MRVCAFGAALSVVCCVGVASAAAAELPPISAFTDSDRFSTMQISPTGEYLSVTMRNEEGATFRVQTYPDLEIKVNRNFGESRDIVASTWVADHHLVVSPAGRGVLDGLAPTGELLSVAVRTGVVKRLGWGLVLDSLPDDAKSILFTTATNRFPEVHRARLGTDRSQRIARGAAPYGYLIPNGDGGVAFSVGKTEDDQTEVYYREGRRWQLLERHHTGEPGWTPEWRTASAHKYYTFDYREGPTAALGIYDAATGTHEPLVVRHPQVDLTNVLFDFGKRNVWGVRFDHHYPEVVYTAPEHPLARTHAMLRDLYPDDIISFTSSSSDHSVSVAEIRSDRKPGTFVLVDLKAKKIEAIANRRPALTPEMLSPMSPAEFKVRDGTTVYGYLTRHPDTKTPGPMVVLVHGGPHGIRDFWGFNAEAQLLASRGYHVLQVNFRGSGGYGTAYLKAGFGEWGGLMQDDLTDATRWAIQSGIADENRVCIFGASYGGYAALTGAAKEPDLYRCAIGYAGIYDLSIMEKVGDVRRRRFGLHYMRQVLGDDPNVRQQRSPVYQADDIKAAVMLVHGGADRRAPLEHAQRMRDALQEAAKPVEWFVKGDQGHGFIGDEARRDLYERILAFLDSQIGSSHIGAGQKLSQRATPAAAAQRQN